MSDDLQIIIGGSLTDERGTITIFNDFDMQSVKRFYRIKHHDIVTVRGWRGHRIEQRWFHVNIGAFSIKLIAIDDWNSPDPRLPQKEIMLRAEESSVLHIPAGYASAIQATIANSEITVFADYGIDHAKFDDYLFPSDYFKL
ncbi:MAG: sugar epimerase [Flavobacterium sp.]|nr:MAG: sugar epimerase [Flavobacterium sp.]